MTFPRDELARQLASGSRPRPTGLLSQAKLLSWNSSTWENVVEWRGTKMTNVLVSGDFVAATLAAGMEIILAGMDNRGDGAMVSWWIIGRVIQPGEGAGELRIRGGTKLVLESGGDVAVEDGGSVTVQGGGDIVVKDGGNVTVEGGGLVDVLEGGAIAVRANDGTVLAAYGDFDAIGTGGVQDGHGLIIQNDVGLDIFRAKENDAGEEQVVAGSATHDVDLFWIGAIEASIVADSIFLVTPDTTGSAANVNMSAFGLISLVTSAARYKQDIEDAQVDLNAVLRLRPRTWRDRREVERDPETDRWHVGLVAEEVDAAGLHEFVDYDEHGQPQAVTYDRLVVALLEVVKDQQHRLDALDGGVTRQPPGTRKPRRRDSRSVQPVPRTPSHPVPRPARSETAPDR